MNLLWWLGRKLPNKSMLLKLFSSGHKPLAMLSRYTHLANSHPRAKLDEFDTYLYRSKIPLKRVKTALERLFGRG
jgi:hypothetical protein